MSILCGHSVPFSETWPAWGSMRDGVAFAHPMPGPHTADSGSSSSHGHVMLPTPRVSDQNGAEDITKRESPQLRTIEQLLATPTVADSRGTRHAGPNRHPGMSLTDHTMALLPTPTSTDSDRGPTPGKQRRGGKTLTDLELFPRPTE